MTTFSCQLRQATEPLAVQNVRRLSWQQYELDCQGADLPAIREAEARHQARIYFDGQAWRNDKSVVTIHGFIPHTE